MLINLGNHPSALWLTWLLRPRYSVAPRRLGRFARFWNQNFTHIVKYPANGRRHQIELNLDALRQFGVFPGEEERELLLVPGEDAEASMHNRMAAQGLATGGFIVIHAPASLAYKFWPVEQTARLIEQLVKDGERIVLTGACQVRSRLGARHSRCVPRGHRRFFGSALDEGAGRIDRASQARDRRRL